MNVIPPSETSLDEVRQNYKDSSKNLLARENQISLTSEDTKSFNHAQRATLRDIATTLCDAQEDLSPNRAASVYGIINAHDSGLDENQQNVLLASLNGVQKAWQTFADTVATVFGVDTRQAV